MNPLFSKRRHLRVSALLFALALGLSGCPSHHHAHKLAKTKAPEAALPAWVMRPPHGCATGHSGPTLNPGDALRNAAQQARALIAAERLGAKVESTLFVGTERTTEASFVESDGWLRGTAVWAIHTAPDGPGSSLRQAFALACAADTSPALPASRLPEWLTDPRRGEAGLCALGVSGPTLDPDDQPENARQDGARALAAARLVRVYSFLADDGSPRVTWLNAEEIPEDALTQALDHTSAKQSWFDADASGPLHEAGVLYVQTCETP